MPHAGLPGFFDRFPLQTKAPASKGSRGPASIFAPEIDKF